MASHPRPMTFQWSLVAILRKTLLERKRVMTWNMDKGESNSLADFNLFQKSVSEVLLTGVDILWGTYVHMFHTCMTIKVQR